MSLSCLNFSKDRCHFAPSDPSSSPECPSGGTDSGSNSFRSSRPRSQARRRHLHMAAESTERGWSSLAHETRRHTPRLWLRPVLQATEEVHRVSSQHGVQRGVRSQQTHVCVQKYGGSSGRVSVETEGW